MPAAAPKLGVSSLAGLPAVPAQAARIGIVIPYFQREPGLLGRALQSVAAQTHAPAQIVVVDDGSPRPVSEEVSPALEQLLNGLTVVHQDNRGIAAARNAGLDALRPEVDAVALLDSDDYWTPLHLQHAATALSLGADFFFSNSRSEGQTACKFDEHPRLAGGNPQGAADLLRWGGSVVALMGAACPFATPSAVFRRSLMPDLRFPLRFRRAGEDQAAFWELLAQSSVIMYSMEPTLVVGSGGMGTWRHARFGVAAHLVRLADEIQLRRHVIGNYAVSDSDRRAMRRAIAARRYVALYSALHLLRRTPLEALGEIKYLIRTDPACLAVWCLDLPTLVYRRLRGKPITTEWTG